MPTKKLPPKERLIKRYKTRIRNLSNKLERVRAERDEDLQEIQDRIDENREMLEALQ